jgi:hypothetical protein
MDKGEIDGVRILRTVSLWDGHRRSKEPVSVVRSIDVLDHIYGENWPDYETASAVIMSWCDEHDAEFYERPRHEFSENEAANIAHKHGRNTVVVDDLS